MNPTNNQPQDVRSKPTLFSPSDTIAIYTTLRILFAMKTHLGLEAMLEYVAKYLAVIERNNPHVKSAVTKALGLIDVSKMYGDVS